MESMARDFVDLERDRNRSRRTFFSFYPLGKDVTDNETSKGIKRKLTQFDEVSTRNYFVLFYLDKVCLMIVFYFYQENHLLCFQLPTILPEFEPFKRSGMSGSNDRSSHHDKGKGKASDKL